MMEKKYTPRPWSVGAGFEKIITDYRDERGNMTDDNWLKGGWAKSVCTVKYSSWMKDDEGLANAHLIAAAPDLLEALEAWKNAGSNEDYLNFVNLRNAAIAKAYGRE